MESPSKKGSRTGNSSVLRALLPLALLIIPLIVYIVATSFTTESNEGFIKWVRYGCIGFAVLVLCWTLVRVFFFVREYVGLRNQKQEMMRKDPLFVIETKMRRQLEDVQQRIKSIGASKYDIPFFAIIGDKPNEIESLVKGSGIVFPKDLKRDNDSSKSRGNWYLGKEAVFFDASSLIHESKKEEWKLSLKTLSKERPRCPINGLILAISADRLLETNKKSSNYELQIQKNLQFMQEVLLQKFPVYLLVTGVDDLSGFRDFFEDMRAADRGQMLGWSNMDLQSQGLDLSRFNGAVKSISNNLNQFLLLRMNKQSKVETADSIYEFSSRLNRLLSGIKKSVSQIFDPNAYLDPITLRGFYLVGKGHAGGMPMNISNSSGSATVVGAGINMENGMPTLVGDAQAMGDFGIQNWFCRDFFTSKLLSESGDLSRPTWVIKKQRIFTLIGGAILAAQLLVAALLATVEIEETSNWREESADVLASAERILNVPIDMVTDAQRDDAAKILGRINDLASKLETDELFQGGSSFGRRGELSDRLKKIHNSVYQKYFLSELLKKVESELFGWDGGKTDYSLFGNKLIEYVRWANPSYEGDLQIDSFLDWGTDSTAVKERQFLLSHFSHDKETPLEVRPDEIAIKRIQKVLEKTNGTARVNLPLQSGDIRRNPGESEWEWWQRVSISLSKLSESIERLIRIEPMTADGLQGDPSDKIYEASQATERLRISFQEVDELAREGEGIYTRWTSSVEDFFGRLENASMKWEPISKAVQKSKERSEFALNKVVDPVLNKNMHLLQFLITRSEGRFRKLLDGVLKERVDLSDRDSEIYKNVATNVIMLLTSFDTFLIGTQTLIKRSGALVSDSNYYKEEDILKSLDKMRQNANQVTKKELEATKALVTLTGMVKEDSPETNDSSESKLSKDALKEQASNRVKDSLVSAMEGRELKKEILAKYHWSVLSKWQDQWRKLLREERAFVLAVYWTELFDWYRPIPKSKEKRNWQEILKLGPLSLGNEMAFAEGIDKFLEKWLASIPEELVKITSKKINNSDLEDFIALFNHVKKFRTTYVPELRRSTSVFVKAVRSMKSGAYENFKRLSESEDVAFSWQALEAFSQFKQNYEINEGIALRNILGSLLEIENEVTKGFRQQLQSEFNTRWNSAIQTARNNSLHNKFPFVRNGESGNFSDVLDVLEQISVLGQAFGIVSGDSEESKELSEKSRTEIEKIVSLKKRKFIQKCYSFVKFLRGSDDAMPELVAKVVSGDIGKHYHWIRMIVGETNYFDMGVYGDKSVRIELVTNPGSVELQGLDVDKTTMAQRSIAKGDFGLLKMTYTFGKSVDSGKRKWLVSSQLSAADSDGEQVAFDMLFTFNQSLPALPIFPN